MKCQIIHTNCDCASGHMIRVVKDWKLGPRCPHCRKVLGPFQYTLGKIIQARNLNEAYRKKMNNEY